MKTISAFSMGFILFIAIFSTNCTKQRSGWSGTIEDVEGVTIIKNHNEPLYGEIEFELEEDLSIGNEEDGNFLFFRIRDIQVDTDGSIYVLDSGNSRVQKFDKEGNYVCTLGKKGQGPGELQRPSWLLLDEGNKIIGVQEMRKLVIFNLEGVYLDRDIALEEFCYDLAVDSAGYLWGLKFVQEGEDEVTADMFKAFGRLTDKVKIDKITAKFTHHHYRERLEGGAVLSRSTGFEYDLFFSLVDDQNLVYGYSENYELYVLDLEGNLKLKFTKDEATSDFSAEEKNRYKKIGLPDYKPFFYSISSDSEGRIFMQKNNARQGENIEKIFDVFSKDGYYLYKIICQITPWVIRDGYFYTRLQNEETGEVFVKRYKILNWDQIEKGI